MKNLKVKILLLSATLLLASKCWIPEKDNYRRRPGDVVKSFVEAVNSGNIDLARTYWSEGSTENIERYFKMPFKEFCKKEFECRHFSVESAIKQKGDYWSVVFKSNCDGASESYLFYTRMIDGSYRLTYQPWSAPKVN